MCVGSFFAYFALSLRVSPLCPLLLQQQLLLQLLELQLLLLKLLLLLLLQRLQQALELFGAPL